MSAWRLDQSCSGVPQSDFSKAAKRFWACASGEGGICGEAGVAGRDISGVTILTCGTGGGGGRSLEWSMSSKRLQAALRKEGRRARTAMTRRLPARSARRRLPKSEVGRVSGEESGCRESCGEVSWLTGTRLDAVNRK